MNDTIYIEGNSDHRLWDTENRWGADGVAYGRVPRAQMAAFSAMRDVYDERQLQYKMWGIANDIRNSPEDWINHMRTWITKAEKCLQEGDVTGYIHRITQATTIGLAAIEVQHMTKDGLQHIDVDVNFDFTVEK